jgi:predicted metal-binding membrane protein
MDRSSALSAWRLTVMAVVVVAALAAWLTLVMLADRPPRHTSAGAGAAHDHEEASAAVKEHPSGSGPAGKAAA